MEFRRPRSIALAAVAALLASTASIAAHATEPTVEAPRSAPAYVRWDATQVTADGNAMRLGRVTTACGGALPRVRVTETRTTVAIVVTPRLESRPAGGGVESCPAGFGLSPFLVKLAKPLAGRRITGPTRGLTPSELAELRPPVGAVVVPDVIGFAPSDAKRALGLALLKGRVVRRKPQRGLPRIISQSPEAGRMLGSEQTVRLLAARQGARS